MRFIAPLLQTKNGGDYDHQQGLPDVARRMALPVICWHRPDFMCAVCSCCTLGLLAKGASSQPTNQEHPCASSTEFPVPCSVSCRLMLSVVHSTVYFSVSQCQISHIIICILWYFRRHFGNTTNKTLPLNLSSSPPPPLAWLFFAPPPPPAPIFPLYLSIHMLVNDPRRVT